MASDRVTLDQIAEALAEADGFLSRQYDSRTVDDDPTLYRVRLAWNAIWRCQGLVQQLRIPAISEHEAGTWTDSVDEAQADSGGTWD